MDIEDLIEIHGFHNIAEWNPKEYWRNPQNDKDFRANIANIANIMNLE